MDSTSSSVLIRSRLDSSFRPLGSALAGIAAWTRPSYNISSLPPL